MTVTMNINILRRVTS